MKSLSRVAACVGLWLAGCTSQPDHFYTLSPLPENEPAVSSAPAVHVILHVTVPALVDRVEMVVSTSATGVVILDHERWPGSLSEQVMHTLARDIERRRADVLVGDSSFDQPTSKAVTLRVDIVRMTVRQGGDATVEAHWRIVDPRAGTDEIGSDVFTERVAATGYSDVANAFSKTLSELAQKLTTSLR